MTQLGTFVQTSVIRAGVGFELVAPQTWSEQFTTGLSQNWRHINQKTFTIFNYDLNTLFILCSTVWKLYISVVLLIQHKIIFKISYTGCWKSFEWLEKTIEIYYTAIRWFHLSFSAWYNIIFIIDRGRSEEGAGK